jgi:hypothetical protein
MKYFYKESILALFFLFFINITAYASGGMSYPLEGEPEVTSPFGWRVHPIFGTEIFHSGVDFAAEEGDDVYAAADGIVNYSGWISGYGNAVILDHGNGIQTLYGHNSQLVVIEGQTILKGEIIAFAGSTGNSTGPHCHFEVDLDGEPVDPADYLDGTLPSSNGSFSNYFKSDYNFIPIDFDASVDFAKPLRDVATAFSDQCTKGLELVKTKIKNLFLILITIDLALSAMWVILFKEDANILTWLLNRVLFFCVLWLMINNWGDWVANLIRNFFVSMGGSVTGLSIEESGKLISDPTLIMQKGAAIVGPIFTYIGTFSGISIFLHIGMIAVALILALAIFICFALISYQILLAYIEFYVIALFSFVIFSFSGLKQIRQYGSYGLNAFFPACIKLMFFCIFSVLLTTTLQQLSISDYFSMGGIENKVSSTNGSDWSKANSASTIDEFMRAIREVETGGSSDPYNTPSDDGYGFGAYQISYDNWDTWCAEAGIEVPADWTPENQDRVAKHKILEYYSEYGNWHDVAIAWNGGDGAVGTGWSSVETYAEKIEAALGHPIQKTLNIILLASILVITLFFLLFANRMTQTIIKLFGGPGFQYTIDHDDEI